MSALDLVMNMDADLQMQDAIDKLKIVRTLQAKLNGYNLDLIIPIEDGDGDPDHISAAQISGRTRMILNDELSKREEYLIQEAGILASIKVYLSTTPRIDSHHIDDLFESLRDYSLNVLPIAKALTGPILVGLIFSRLKLRHFIENGRIEDDYFRQVLDFPMFERRQLVQALFRSGGLDILLTGYKTRLMKYELETLTREDRRINHYLVRLLSEIIEIRQGGGSYLDMADKDIPRDDESRVIRQLEQMETETCMGGDEFIFALFSDCYLQGFNLFK